MILVLRISTIVAKDVCTRRITGDENAVQVLEPRKEGKHREIWNETHNGNEACGNGKSFSGLCQSMRPGE